MMYLKIFGFLMMSAIASTGAYASGVSDLANSQRIRYGVSAGMNTGMAIQHFAGCGFGALWNCVIGAAAAGQAGLDIAGLISARNACQATGTCRDPAGNPYPTIPPYSGWPDDPNGGGGGDGGSGGGSGGGGDPYNPENLKRQVKKIQDDYKKKGFEMLGNGHIKTPKGIVTPEMLASGAALSEAGIIDPSQIADYNAAVSDYQNKIKMINGAQLAGGGGGGRMPASHAESSGFDMSMFMRKPETKAALTSGLSKNFGNDPVGIATDDLFQMVHRRYRALDSKNTFVGE